VISRVTDVLVEIPVRHSLRVAIDGIITAGKTTFADELAEEVRARGRACLRVSMDVFHQSSAVRYSLRRDSADGYAGASRPSSMPLGCACARGHAINVDSAPLTEDKRKDQITRAVTLRVSQMQRGTALPFRS
jgi:cytidylate kinase